MLCSLIKKMVLSGSWLLFMVLLMKKFEFLEDSVMDAWQGLILIGGDFNLVRFVSDKNNSIINHKWKMVLRKRILLEGGMVEKAWSTPLTLSKVLIGGNLSVGPLG